MAIATTDNEDDSPSGSTISMEHTPTGVGLPEWLLNHFINDSPTIGKPRLMVIHATDTGRRQSVEEIGRELQDGLDPSLLQTIDRLIEAVHVDLRLPRTLADDGTTSLLVHAACQLAAADFAFPVIPRRIQITHGMVTQG
jgi:hypothetical protein